MDYYDGMPDPDEISQSEMESQAEQQEEHFRNNCPNDTDGDGNCGRPACPHCGKYKLHQDVVFIEPQRDISDTPAPQRRADQY